MEAPGARLRKIRLEKGISLEEINKKTKIHLNILKAIEEDSLINFSPVYLKGFLKIYCKFLGVNPKDYIPDYKEPQSQLILDRQVADAQGHPLSLIKTASIKLEALSPQIKIKIVLRVIIIIIFIIGMFKLGKMVSSKRGASKKTAKAPIPFYTVDKSTGKKVQITKSKQVTQAPTIKSGQSIAIAQKTTVSGIRLGIRAKEDCWVQLKIDGHVVFQNILRKGRFESWQAKSKIEFSLGNAGVVDLEVNGRLILGLGRRGQVIKNILITPEGLSIPK